MSVRDIASYILLRTFSYGILGEIFKGFQYHRRGVSWRHFWVCRLSSRRTRICYEIRLHLDNYIRETLDEYKTYTKKRLRPKCTPIQPGLVRNHQDCPILPDPKRQTFYRPSVAKHQFAASWIRLDTAYPLAHLDRSRCPWAQIAEWLNMF